MKGHVGWEQQPCVWCCAKCQREEARKGTSALAPYCGGLRDVTVSDAVVERETCPAFPNGLQQAKQPSLS